MSGGESNKAKVKPIIKIKKNIELINLIIFSINK